MDNDAFKVFADKLGEYVMTKFVIPYLHRHGYVQAYRASVISKDANTKTMTIQRPYDNQITVPYGDSASPIQAGDDCTVFVLGESSNARVIADGNLNI